MLLDRNVTAGACACRLSVTSCQSIALRPIPPFPSLSPSPSKHKVGAISRRVKKIIVLYLLKFCLKVAARSRGRGRVQHTADTVLVYLQCHFQVSTFRSGGCPSSSVVIACFQQGNTSSGSHRRSIDRLSTITWPFIFTLMLMRLRLLAHVRG